MYSCMHLFAHSLHRYFSNLFKIVLCRLSQLTVHQIKYMLEAYFRNWANKEPEVEKVSEPGNLAPRNFEVLKQV